MGGAEALTSWMPEMWASGAAQREVERYMPTKGSAGLKMATTLGTNSLRRTPKTVARLPARAARHEDEARGQGRVFG